MPTREAIQSTVSTPEVAKPIPTRTISTRTILRPAAQRSDQASTIKSGPDAVSSTPEESVRLSPQLSALARKEQAYRQREQALKLREKEIEEKLAKATQYEELETKFKSKDFSEAEKLGLNYEEYTQYLLAKQTGEDPTADKFKSLEQKIQDLEKGKEEQAAREYEDTVSEYRREITSLIASNPEFSSVKELGREDAVLQLILDSWEEDGEELSIEQASKDIEDYLVEQGKKFTGLTKFKPAEVESKLPPPRPGPRTLTNQMQPPQGTVQPQKSLQHLSESERYAEARRRVLARRQQQGS